MSGQPGQGEGPSHGVEQAGAAEIKNPNLGINPDQAGTPISPIRQFKHREAEVSGSNSLSPAEIADNPTPAIPQFKMHEVSAAEDNVADKTSGIETQQVSMSPNGLSITEGMWKDSKNLSAEDREQVGKFIEKKRAEGDDSYDLPTDSNIIEKEKKALVEKAEGENELFGYAKEKGIDPKLAVNNPKVAEALGKVWAAESVVDYSEDKVRDLERGLESKKKSLAKERIYLEEKEKELDNAILNPGDEIINDSTGDEGPESSSLPADSV